MEANYHIHEKRPEHLEKHFKKRPKHQEKHMQNKNKDHYKREFIKFNSILIGSTILLGIISHLIPKMPQQIKSPFIINNILPLIYFAIFSFFFGAIFLIGDDTMKGYLLEYFSNTILDIGIIAAYTGVVAIIMAIFIKNIIQKILGTTITSSPIHDIIGFIIGRIILLTFVDYLNLQ